MTVASFLAPGSLVGGEYVVVRPLEEGGMGAVYVVLQRSTGKQRALKVMHREIVADPQLQRRFEQEAKIGSHFESEHVVEVLAAGVDQGVPWLVMELLDGEDLRHRLDERGAMTAGEVRVVFEQLCHAMAAAHHAGVVHRDLKPENVFLTKTMRASSEPFTVKVLDFGIAKLEAEAGTRATKGAVGSPLWMAPEQTSPGPVTAAADVWAMGLLAYELLVGQSFWRAAHEEGGTTAQLLREIVLDPIPAASVRAAGNSFRLPLGFDAWFAKCLERDPTKRFADADVTWRAMQAMFGGRAQQEMAETFAATPAKPMLRLSLDATTPPLDSAPPPVNAVSEHVRMETPPRNETPVTTVQTAPPPAAPQKNRAAIIVGASIAIAGIAVGWGISQRRPEVPAPVVVANTQQPAPTPAPPTPASVAITPDPAPAPSSTPSPSKLTAPVASSEKIASAPAASASAKPRTVGGGFSDPVDRKGAVLWKVQGHQIRLFTKLVSNESNVNDATVRNAMEHSSWEYLRCYERAFSGSKDLPEATVAVDFEIIDQLPRHGKLRSSTLENGTFNTCVVNTLIGQTINAAGPEGKGKAAMSFRFVPMD